MRGDESEAFVMTGGVRELRGQILRAVETVGLMAQYRPIAQCDLTVEKRVAGSVDARAAVSS